MLDVMNGCACHTGVDADMMGCTAIGDNGGILSIERVDGDRSRFMSLLIIGDESEEMIARYLDRGDLYVGFMGETAVAVCVTTSEDDEVTEVKNLAVSPEFQRRGIGRRMLAYVESLNVGKTMILGTGETPSILRFYCSCGYVYSHRVIDFFADNYPYPIVEEGVTLKDMVYFTKQV